MKGVPVKRILIYLTLLVAVAAVSLVFLFFNPAFVFPHSRTFKNITFYDTKPIPKSAELILNEIDDRLSDGVFSSRIPLDLFIAHDGWRNWIYFRLSPEAGGVVYYPLTHSHGFLAGADYDTGALVKNGRALGPPRTLAYYGAHELTHVLIGRRLGAATAQELPLWISEGLADYVALGAPDDIAALDEFLGDAEIDIKIMTKYGAYVRDRMLVSWFLEHENWTLDQLLSSDLNQAQALAHMREILEEIE